MSHEAHAKEQRVRKGEITDRIPNSVTSYDHFLQLETHVQAKCIFVMKMNIIMIYIAVF